MRRASRAGVLKRAGELLARTGISFDPDPGPELQPVALFAFATARLRGIPGPFRLSAGVIAQACGMKYEPAAQALADLVRLGVLRQLEPGQYEFAARVRPGVNLNL